jgi:hypothetical protein
MAAGEVVVVVASGRRRTVAGVCLSDSLGSKSRQNDQAVTEQRGWWQHEHYSTSATV